MRTRLSDLLNSTMGNPRSRASLPLPAVLSKIRKTVAGKVEAA